MRHTECSLLSCLESLDADHGLFECGGVPREEEDVAHDHDGRGQAQPRHVRRHRVPEQHHREGQRRSEQTSHYLDGEREFCLGL